VVIHAGQHLFIARQGRNLAHGGGGLRLLQRQRRGSRPKQHRAQRIEPDETRITCCPGISADHIQTQVRASQSCP